MYALSIQFNMYYYFAQINQNNVAGDTYMSTCAHDSSGVFATTANNAGRSST